MTHIKNVPHILKHGVTHKNSPHASSSYVSIGDNSLIGSRDKKTLKVNNGESWSLKHKTIILGDYIPFYFGKRMPMLYVIQKGYNKVAQQLPQNIIYCVCSLEDIFESGIDYYFTDGHATDNLSSCYEKSFTKKINKIIDFSAVKTTDWTIERDLKRKMEAECLIATDIKPQYIIAYICYDDSAKIELMKMGVTENLIHIRPNYYF